MNCPGLKLNTNLTNEHLFSETFQDFKIAQNPFRDVFRKRIFMVNGKGFGSRYTLGIRRGR